MRYAYISADGRSVTDWHGMVIGTVLESRKVRLSQWSYVHGSYWFAYRVKMDDGVMMYGRSSPGICITLRPYKV